MPTVRTTEQGARGVTSGLGVRLPVKEGGRLERQTTLRLTQALASRRHEVANLVEGQVGEEPQQALNVGVVAVHPELVVGVRRRLGAIKPHPFAAGGLAHLLARLGKQEWRGEGEGRARLDAPDQVGAGKDVRPLVAPAELQGAPVASEGLEEVVGLEQHVVELKERQASLKARLVGVRAQHFVHGEVAAVVAQEGDVVQGQQPLGVVDQEPITR